MKSKMSKGEFLAKLLADHQLTEQQFIKESNANKVHEKHVTYNCNPVICKGTHELTFEKVLEQVEQQLNQPQVLFVVEVITVPRFGFPFGFPFEQF